MPHIPYTPAIRTQVAPRVLVAGPPGSGTTPTALAWAHTLTDSGRLLVFCTERGEAAHYATNPDAPDDNADAICPFDMVVLGNANPITVAEHLQEAWQADYDGIVIDSLSAMWAGPGGILDIVNKSKEAGDASPWARADRAEHTLNEAITLFGRPIVSVVHTRVEWTLQPGATDPEALYPARWGTKLIQRDVLERAYHVVAVANGGSIHITKSKPPALRGTLWPIADAAPAEQIRRWAATGEPADTWRTRIAAAASRSELRILHHEAKSEDLDWLLPIIRVLGNDLPEDA